MHVVHIFARFLLRLMCETAEERARFFLPSGPDFCLVSDGPTVESPKKADNPAISGACDGPVAISRQHGFADMSAMQPNTAGQAFQQLLIIDSVASGTFGPVWLCIHRVW